MTVDQAIVQYTRYTRMTFIVTIAAGNSFGSNFNTVYERLTLMIFRECNVRRVARLLALVCLTFGGLPPKRFDEIRKEMTHQYGPPTLLLLLHMEQAGLLFRSEERHSGYGLARFPNQAAHCLLPVSKCTTAVTFTSTGDCYTRHKCTVCPYKTLFYRSW